MDVNNKSIIEDEMKHNRKRIFDWLKLSKQQIQYNKKVYSNMHFGNKKSLPVCDVQVFNI